MYEIMNYWWKLTTFECRGLIRYDLLVSTQHINMVYCRAASKQVARGPIPIEAGVFNPLDWWYRLRVHHITQKNPTTVLRQRFSYNVFLLRKWPIQSKSNFDGSNLWVRWVWVNKAASIKTNSTITIFFSSKHYIRYVIMILQLLQGKFDQKY